MKEDILIVDDQPDNLRLLSAYLKKENYNVRKATNAEMALKAIGEAAPSVNASDLPDLILLDIQMPGMNGYELCSQLKENADTKNIPIIFISGRNKILDKGMAFEVGGVDYIVKPFHELEVAMRVNHQITIARQLKELQKLRLQLQKRNHHVK